MKVCLKNWAQNSNYSCENTKPERQYNEGFSWELGTVVTTVWPACLWHVSLWGHRCDQTVTLTGRGRGSCLPSIWWQQARRDNLPTDNTISTQVCNLWDKTRGWATICPAVCRAMEPLEIPAWHTGLFTTGTTWPNPCAYSSVALTTQSN